MAGLTLTLFVTLGSVAPTNAEVVLRRGNNAEPETLDPHRATGFPEAFIFYDLYEGLVTRDAAGRPIPGVAQRWETSTDGRTITFYLRPDGKWSDGSPITADDVVFSFRRMADPATGNVNGKYFWPVVNGRAVTAGRMPPKQLGVRAIDPLTVVFDLEYPAPYFASMLSFPMLVVLKEDNVRQHGSAFTQPGKLVSSGAYMLAEAVPNDRVTLVRNPHYRDAGSVSIDKVIFYPTEVGETEIKSYRTGQLDMTFLLPPNQLPWVKENFGDQLRVQPLLGTFYYAPNLNREPWRSNRLLRQALAMAIDRTIITEKITQGGEVPSYSYVPPGLPNYTPYQPLWAHLPQAERERQAKQLLAQAGYPGGIGPDGKRLWVELLFNTQEYQRRVGVTIAAMWKSVLGVETLLTNQEWRVFLETRRVKSFKDFARNSYVGAYDDANVFLEYLLSDAGPENPSGYANPEFDRLVRAATLELDPDKRRVLLLEAERLAIEDAAVLPVFTLARARLVSPKIQGWIDNPLDAHPSRFLSIKP